MFRASRTVRHSIVHGRNSSRHRTMRRPDLAALILDVGGVLIETPTRDARSAWERAHGLEQGQLDRIVVEAIGPGWEGGKSEAEIEARLCEACGIDPSGLADLLGALAAD